MNSLIVSELQWGRRAKLVIGEGEHGITRRLEIIVSNATLNPNGTDNSSTVRWCGYLGSKGT